MGIFQFLNCKNHAKCHINMTGYDYLSKIYLRLDSCLDKDRNDHQCVYVVGTPPPSPLYKRESSFRNLCKKRVGGGSYCSHIKGGVGKIGGCFKREYRVFSY